MISVNGFHIEPTNICTLKCAGCARTRFIQQWPQHWKNHSLDSKALFDFLDIDITGLKIYFCGNYGDPIYHPDFIGLVKSTKARAALVSIITNGSYRTGDWWQELCAHLSEQDSVCFSIDGTPENFTQYRANADWQSIKKGIEVCVDHGIHTIWKLIPFAFNQQHIDQARSLAAELGVDEFQIDPSDRYDDQTQHLMPAEQFLGWRNLARKQSSIDVDPKCLKGFDHFITATGHYAPCCFVADHRFYHKTTFGKDRNLFDIRNTTFSRLMSANSVIDFFDQLPSSPLSVCKFNCPKEAT